MQEALDRTLERVSKDIRPSFQKYQRLYGKIAGQPLLYRVDKFIPFILEGKADLFEYTGEGHLLFFEEPARTRERMENQQEEIQDLCDVLTEKGMVLGETYELLFDTNTILDSAGRHPIITLASLGGSESLTSYPAACFHVNGASISPYIRRMDLLFDDIKKWAGRYRILILVSGWTGSAGLWLSSGTEAYRRKTLEILHPGRGSSVVVGSGTLQSGFIYRDEKLVVVTESDISARSMRKAPRKAPAREGGLKPIPISSLRITWYIRPMA